MADKTEVAAIDSDQWKLAANGIQDLLEKLVTDGADVNAKDDQERLQLQKKYEVVDKTEVCVVVSGEQNEVDKFRKLGLDIEPHRKNMIERNLEKEFSYLSLLFDHTTQR